jgi:hypothetical protein
VGEANPPPYLFLLSFIKVRGRGFSEVASIGLENRYSRRAYIRRSDNVL